MLLLIPIALLAGAGDARAQSAWAKGDRAFQAGRYAQAESLYALRAGAHPTPALRFNRATAGLLAGRGEEGEKELGGLLGLNDRAGLGARYNLGTSLGGRNQIDSALSVLRDALERAPNDEDARWNYEVLLRRKHEQQKQKNPPPSPQQKPDPKPQPNAPDQQGPSPPSNGPQSPQAPPQSGSQSQSPPPPRGSDGMTRQQAEQLLGALQDLARVDEQRQRRVRVMRERRGRDW